MQPPLNQPLRNSAKTVKSSEYRHPLTECHCHQGRRQLPLLIIDEAHDLRNDVLEELRLLTSYDLRAHRLRLAGCSQALFEPTAVEALFKASEGLLRPLDRIAHYALLGAALDQARTVSAAHVERALPEARARSPVQYRAR